VIMNLAVNSRDAMPQGGKFTVETSNVELDESEARNHEGAPPGKYVMLTVSDTGDGMDSETQAHMFEPFFTTKAPGKGTGLGLATVYGVVKQSDGWIWVDSAPGRGTTFKIHLPRVEESTAEEFAAEECDAELFQSAARPPCQTTQDLAAAPKGTETGLVVEDQDGIRDIVGESLRRNGYKVIIAEDGDEALQIANSFADPIHLLVTDLVMPNIGGRELASRLTHLRPQMKVLFMSGYPEHAALNNDVVDLPADVLQKPFSLAALARNVRSALDQREE
jgi:two-component system, cell cycle sensor histidine kinase and response regulator CckA